MARGKQQARKPKQVNGSQQSKSGLAKTPPGGKANPKAPNSAPKFGKQQTPVNGKKNTGDLLAGAGKKTPQSAPQVKRKKLAEEIDEEISDEDFEELLQNVRKNDKKQKGSKKNLAEEEDDSDAEFDEDEDDEDLGSEDDDEDEEDDEDGEDDDEDMEDDDDESADEEELMAALKAKQQAGKNSKQATPVQQAKGTPAAAASADKKAAASASAATPTSKKTAAAATTPASKATTPASKATTPAPAKSEQKQKAAATTPTTTKSPAAPTLDSKQQDAFRNDVVNDLQKQRTNADDRDRKSLFVKNLPPTTTEDELKALSGDIVSVRLRVSYKKNTANKGFAFVEFKDEATAEKNLPILKKKKVGGNEIVVDYCGSKAINAPPQKPQKVRTEPEDFDPLKLFVTGFDRVNTTVATLQQFFPNAKEITMPRRKSKNNTSTGYAFVVYDDVAKCKKAHADAQNKTIKGERLVVVYAKRHSQVHPPKSAAAPAAKRPLAETGKKAEPSAKKAKVAKVEVEEDDDDDDDDDYDDIEDDEDDDDEGDDDDDIEDDDDDEEGDEDEDDDDEDDDEDDD